MKINPDYIDELVWRLTHRREDGEEVYQEYSPKFMLCKICGASTTSKGHPRIERHVHGDRVQRTKVFTAVELHQCTQCHAMYSFYPKQKRQNVACNDLSSQMRKKLEINNLDQGLTSLSGVEYENF